MTNSIFLWPPNPDPESWKTDLPNEGLYFEFDEQYISEQKNDYHGVFLARLDVDGVNWIEGYEDMPDEQYKAAYKVIKKVFTNPNFDPNLPYIWEFCVSKCIRVLEKLGWFEVEAHEEVINGEHHYFRRKK